jgi:WD40 repeat protein
MGKGAMVRGLIFVCVLSFWGLAALPPGAVAELRLGRVADMAFTPDAHGLLLLQENRVELWDFRTGKLIRSFLGHSGLVWCLAVSQDSDSFFTGALDRTVREWNLKTGEPLWTSSELPAEVFSLALTEQYLAAGLGEGTVFLWERTSKNLVRTWSTGKSGVYALAFDKDGKILAAGTGEGKVIFLDLVSGAVLFALEAHRGPVWAIAFGPEGFFATGSSDRTARLFRMPKVEPLATFSHKGTVWDLLFLEQTQALATVSADLTFRLFSLPTGYEIAELRPHAAQVNRIAGSADKKFLATASEDGRVLVWDFQKLLSLRPKITAVLYAKEISRSQYILVTVEDPNADIVSVRIFVEPEFPGTVSLSPGASFDPKVAGKTQASFGFQVTVTRPQKVRLTLVVTDSLGLASEPKILEFSVR